MTEILARPLLERFFPELADTAQPLAGEFAVRRKVLDEVTLADGYAVDIALLIDVWARFGRQAIVEVDLGERSHRNRPLDQLCPNSRVARPTLRRANRHEWTAGTLEGHGWFSSPEL